jgi:DNA mismatch endonuclease (patch repair protein)
VSQWPGNARSQRTTFGRLSRSQLMSRVRSRGNETTEIRFAKLLRKARVYGWRRHQRLTGNPDFVWRKKKLAVFVDGCFWHGHTCGKNITPKTNKKAWRHKIDLNKERDARVTRVLRRKGWHVVRIWECHLAKNPQACLNRVERAIEHSQRAGFP